MKRNDELFTGRDALRWILVFFGTIAAVNGVMVWIALTTGGGS